ncbi:hypothetical protein SprV_0100437000 [Sparganum proliferum]
MKRKYFGVNRNTAYKRVRRLKRVYYAATESAQHVTVPTASTWPSDSPELEMPELTTEVSTAAIREHAAFSNCTVDTIRKSTIDWFHSARDRYGGRSKRRDNTTVNTTLPVRDNTAEQYPLHSPSEDTNIRADQMNADGFATISSLVAELILLELENFAFDHYEAAFWRWYMADTFVIIERSRLAGIQGLLHGTFPDTQFPRKEVHAEQLPFVDVLITSTPYGEPSTTVYRKATNTT